MRSIRLSPPSVMNIALAWNDATTTANTMDIALVRQPSMKSAHVTTANA